MEKQEMKQIISMLTRIQERMIYHEDLEEMMAIREADRKTDHEETMAMLKAWGKTLDAWSTDTNDNGEETMACQGNMGAHLEGDKPASVDTAPEVADDQEIPVEDAEVWSVVELRKRCWDSRNLTAVCRQKKQN
jgi:hypothetical protein